MDTNEERIRQLEQRMTASEDRERLESREFVAVATELKETRKIVSGMDEKLDTALDYISQQKGRENANKAFYSLGGGAISAVITYYLTKWGGNGGS